MQHLKPFGARYYRSRALAKAEVKTMWKRVREREYMSSYVEYFNFTMLLLPYISIEIESKELNSCPEVGTPCKYKENIII